MLAASDAQLQQSPQQQQQRPSVVGLNQVDVSMSESQSQPLPQQQARAPPTYAESERSQPQAQSQRRRWVAIYAKGVNIRSAPSNKAEIVGKLARGESVQELERQNAWLKHERGWSIVRVGDVIAMEPAVSSVFAVQRCVLTRLYRSCRIRSPRLVQ